MSLYKYVLYLAGFIILQSNLSFTSFYKCWFHLSKQCYFKTGQSFLKCFSAKSNLVLLFMRLGKISWGKPSYSITFTKLSSDYRLNKNIPHVVNVDKGFFLCYYIFDLDTPESFYSGQEFSLTASKSKSKSHLYDLTSYPLVYKVETKQKVLLSVIFMQKHGSDIPQLS